MSTDTTPPAGTPAEAPAAAEALPFGPIALIGMRGAGKTTVGRILAERTGRPFLDLDQETLRRARQAGHRAASTAELLTSVGASTFRDFEASALRRICEPSLRVVLATGGGVVERADACSWLGRAACTVWLDAPLELLERRVAADGAATRPGLTGDDPVAELGQLLARRAPLYRKLADRVVDVGGLEPGPAAAAVLVAARAVAAAR